MNNIIIIGIIILTASICFIYLSVNHDRLIKENKIEAKIGYTAPIGPTKEPPLYRLKSEAIIDGN